MTLDWPLQIGYFLLNLTIVGLYGMLLSGIVARTLAKVQGRIGIPVYQPFIDLFKNLGKRTAVSHGAMFYLGPVFRLAGGIGTLAFVPVLFGSEMFSNFNMAGDLLLAMYFMFFGQLGMAIGAGESGHPFSAIGIARGLGQMTAYEVPFALAIIAIVVQYDTLSINDIVAAQQGGVTHWTLFTNPLAVAAAMLAFLGMTGYSPFDVMMAPNEIPIGPPTEYHSSYLALMQTNRVLYPIAKTVIYMNLFFGGATSWAEFAVKVFAIYMVSVLIGVVHPRFRVEQSIRFFLKWGLPVGVLAIMVV